MRLLHNPEFGVGILTEIGDTEDQIGLFDH